MTKTDDVRARKTIMMPQFIPSKDWIDKEVIAKGKGTVIIVGRVYGIVMDAKEKLTKLPSGETQSSIALLGMFEATNLHDKERSDANVAYLSGDEARRMQEECKKHKALFYDVDIVISHSGKGWEMAAVPHAGTVEPDVMTFMRNSRPSKEKK